MQLSNESVAGWLHFEDALVVFFCDFSVNKGSASVFILHPPPVHPSATPQTPATTTLPPMRQTAYSQTREGLIIAIASNK